MGLINVFQSMDVIVTTLQKFDNISFLSNGFPHTTSTVLLMPAKTPTLLHRTRTISVFNLKSATKMVGKLDHHLNSPLG